MTDIDRGTPPRATIAERVAAGAAFLDEHDPEWWRADVERAIDLDKLKMYDGETCMLGQRCPLSDFAENRYAVNKYEAQAVSLSGFDVVDEFTKLIDWSQAHGFQAYDMEDRAEYVALGAEWKRVITGRRPA